MANTKAVGEMIAELKSEGWDVEKTKGGHYKAKWSNGKSVIFSSTPSDDMFKHMVRKYCRRVIRG
jgi:predicted RNA binding protein YcfA (HicA-like mRNA interferase family)